MKILFITPYPTNTAPSQRFRFEQYFKLLSDKKHTYEINSFLDERNWRVLFTKRELSIKVIVLLFGYFKRILMLLNISDFDLIFIHREITPIGPPVFEWIITKVLKKKVIYDFDDAIWLTDKFHESWFASKIRWRSKVASICKWSYKVSCGNEYLSNYARKFNASVIINPTTIDPSTHLNSTHKVSTKTVTVGWTGSYSTIKYLLSIESVIQKIQRTKKIKFITIADQKPELKLKSMEHIPWSQISEIEDLNKIDIGIMPLPDDDWAKGKCGFKALQYMAMAKPCVASPVGINSEIIENGVHGYLASTQEEWFIALTMLIENSALRKTMGENGRKKVIQNYSVASNSSNFLSLFD